MRRQTPDDPEMEPRDSRSASGAAHQSPAPDGRTSEEEQAARNARTITMIAESIRYAPHTYARSLIKGLLGRPDLQQLAAGQRPTSNQRYDAPLVQFATYIQDQRREAETKADTAPPEAFLYQSSKSLQKFENLVFARAATIEPEKKSKIEMQLNQLDMELLAEGRLVGEDPRRGMPNYTPANRPAALSTADAPRKDPAERRDASSTSNTSKRPLPKRDRDLGR